MRHGTGRPPYGLCEHVRANMLGGAFSDFIGKGMHDR